MPARLSPLESAALIADVASWSVDLPLGRAIVADGVAL
jgi:hypothetical protein